MLMDMVLRLARLLGLFALARRLTRGQLRILCYHGVWMGPAPHYGDRLFMSPEQFRERMAWLRRESWNVLPLDEALRRLDHGAIGERDVVITIDDGWLGTARHMVPVLREQGFAATLYIATCDLLAGGPVPNVVAGYLVARGRVPASGPRPRWAEQGEMAEALAAHLHAHEPGAPREAALREAADWLGVDHDALLQAGSLNLMSDADLRTAQAGGIDVQLHTHTHSLHELQPQQVQGEIERNRAELSALLGRPAQQLQHFCYPSGVHAEAAFAPLRACGVTSATTTEFGLVARTTERMALPRILDGQSMSAVGLEARLSGLWVLPAALRSWSARGRLPADRDGE